MILYTIRIVFLFFCLCCPVLASAAPETQDMRAFETLPVLDEGRVKPLGRFARVTLKTYAGSESLASMGASAWLAMSLFDPVRAAEIEVFALPSANLRAQMGLTKKKKLYSFQDLKAGLDATMPEVAALAQKKPEDMTPEEAALVALHDHASQYVSILRSFSAVLPLQITLPPPYAAKVEGDMNYMTLAPFQKPLEAALKKVMARKGMNPKTYNAQELQLAEAAFQLRNVRAGGERNTALRVFPSDWDTRAGEAEAGRWFSPWEILLEGHGSPATRRMFEKWQALAAGYRAGDGQGWNTALSALKAEVAAQTKKGGDVDPVRLTLENWYGVLHPYWWVIGFYVLGAAAFLWSKTRLVGVAFGALGLLCHGLSIAARIVILARPPVGTLYESVLFVSLMCAVFALGAFFRKKTQGVFVAGMICAAGLLMLAPVALPKGDNLEVLVAVLNTNFWLGTHVICITIGYSLCIFAAVMAHIALAFHHEKLRGAVHYMSLLALSFMTVGTILGGIWADQSWGRFWGWDPKENGALLIVLWLIWAQHGRLAGHLRQAGFLVVIALTNVVVALSWFGVNLLGVGLHSYGFTSGMAGGLALFCVAESALIAALYVFGTRRLQGKGAYDAA